MVEVWDKSCSAATDYETLRALDSDNVSTTSMSEEEINALPVHKYKVLDPEKWVNIVPCFSFNSLKCFQMWKHWGIKKIVS